MWINKNLKSDVEAVQDHSPERRLALAMFERGIIDYFFTTSTQYGRDKLENRESAEAFFMGEDSEIWAELFNLEYFLEHIRRLIKQDKEGELDHDKFRGVHENTRGANSHDIQKPARRRIRPS